MNWVNLKKLVSPLSYQTNTEESWFSPMGSCTETVYFVTSCVNRFAPDDGFSGMSSLLGAWRDEYSQKRPLLGTFYFPVNSNDPTHSR